MTVIISTVNNLLDGAFGPLNEDQRRWLKKLGGHTTHLEELLNDVLDMIRLQTGESRVNPPPESNAASAMPPAHSSQAHIGKIEAASLSSMTPKILIVDDEADVRDVIREGMEIKGFQTFTAATGEEALRSALETRPDVVIMDVLLGGENGIEVCRRIKENLDSFVPVILVTGQEDLREKVSGKSHAADDLLTKPFQMEELFSRVNSMLRLKQLTDELERFRTGTKRR